MRQVVVSTVGYAITAGLIALVVVLIGVDRTDLVLDAYLVFVGALVALAAARIAASCLSAPDGHRAGRALAAAEAVRASRVAVGCGR